MEKIKVMHVTKNVWKDEKSKLLGVPGQLAVNMGLYSDKIESFAVFTRKGQKIKNAKAEHGNIFSVIKRFFYVRPDVVIIHQFFGLPQVLFLQLILKILGIKNIIGLDLVQEHFVHFEIKKPKKLIKEIVKFFLMYSQTLLADKLWCRTQNEIDIISPLMHISKKFFIIPPGHDFEIGTLPKDQYILAVSGWWSDRKNIYTALKVFSKIVEKKEFSKYEFVVVGKFFKGRYRILDERKGVYTDRWETGEEYELKVKKFIDRSNLKNNVRFVGTKTGKELQKLFRQAKIYYMPSKSEGFGQVWVEAMASGTPVVAMKNSAVQYIVRDGIVGFLRNTEKEQEEAILTLLNDNTLYKRVQRNCLKEAGRYQWKNVIKKWEKLINSLT